MRERNVPDLPTFTVTQLTADRVIAAFEGQVDETGQPLAPIDAYRRWLRQSLVNHVMRYEANLDADSLESELT